MLLRKWIVGAVAAAVLIGPFPARAMPEGIKPELSVGSDEKVVATFRLNGVQIYECQRAMDRNGIYAWVFLAPQALITDNTGNVIGNHYAGPVWEANDGSKVKGAVKARQDAGPANIPWLLLSTTAERAGLFGGVSSIHRVNTQGGVAPVAGCSVQTQGRRVHVGYSADYHFYKRQ